MCDWFFKRRVDKVSSVWYQRGTTLWMECVLIIRKCDCFPGLLKRKWKWLGGHMVLTIKVITTCARKGLRFWPAAIFMLLDQMVIHVYCFRSVCLSINFNLPLTRYLVHLLDIHAFWVKNFHKKSMLTSLWPWPWNPWMTRMGMVFPSCVLFSVIRIEDSSLK